MIKEITFFDNCEELEQLTGLSHNELWEHNFNLDDMDWGFVTDKKYVTELIDEYGCIDYDIQYENIPGYIFNILNWVQEYCIGFHYTEYNGKHYYTLHHA